MSDVIQFPKKKGNYGVEFIGPIYRSGFDIIVDGHRLPHIDADISESGGVTLVLDRRYAIDLQKEDAEKILPFLANAMAVAAGYSCHGDNCNKLNPFKVKVQALDEVPQ